MHLLGVLNLISCFHKGIIDRIKLQEHARVTRKQYF